MASSSTARDHSPVGVLRDGWTSVWPSSQYSTDFLMRDRVAVRVPRGCRLRPPPTRTSVTQRPTITASTVITKSLRCTGTLLVSWTPRVQRAQLLPASQLFLPRRWSLTPDGRPFISRSPQPTAVEVRNRLRRTWPGRSGLRRSRRATGSVRRSTIRRAVARDDIGPPIGSRYDARTQAWRRLPKLSVGLQSVPGIPPFTDAVESTGRASRGLGDIRGWPGWVRRTL